MNANEMRAQGPTARIAADRRDQVSIEVTMSTWMAKALQYQELLEGARRERDSALALHDKASEQLRQYKERAETAERERDAAIIKAAEMKEELELAHSQGRQAEAVITQERDAALAQKAKAEARDRDLWEHNYSLPSGRE